MISHSVRAPAQGQLAEIAGSKHQRLVQVGEPEQVTRALARLNVFKSNVVDRLSVRVGMFDVAQHLLAAWPNVQLVRRTADGGHQRSGVFQSVFACRKSGHRVGKNVGAREF